MISGMPLKIVSATDDEVWQAANFKNTFPISYADGFAASAAVTKDALLVTRDTEFLTLGNLVLLFGGLGGQQ